jgi:hypothetical protein
MLMDRPRLAVFTVPSAQLQKPRGRHANLSGFYPPVTSIMLLKYCFELQNFVLAYMPKRG